MRLNRKVFMIEIGLVNQNGRINKRKNGLLNTEVFSESWIGGNPQKKIPFDDFKKLLQNVYIKWHYHGEYKQDYKDLEDWLDKKLEKLLNSNLSTCKKNELSNNILLLEKEKFLLHKINEIQLKTVSDEIFNLNLSDYYDKYCKFLDYSEELFNLRNDSNNRKKGLFNKIINPYEFNEVTRKRVDLIYFEQGKLLDSVKNKEFTYMQLCHSEINYAREMLSEIRKELNFISKQKIRDEKQQSIENKKKLDLVNKKREFNELKNRLVKEEVGKRRVVAKLKPHILHHGSCPYCEIKFTDEIIIHLDHIHPIKLGGLEREDNLVKVCSTCNLKKSDLTLREFFKKYNLDRDQIENNLVLLNKKF